MTILINTLLFIIPITGLLSGLSLSFTVPVFLLACLYLIKNEIKINFKNLKIEALFIMWLIISCFGSIDILSSLFSFLKSFSVVCVIYLLISNKDAFCQKFTFSTPLIVISFIISLMLFHFEYYSNGLINSAFREIVQKKQDTNFYLYYLDRGCVVISLFSWFMLAHLIKKEQKLLALIVYLSTMYTLYLSDSLASFLGFSVSGLVFIITRYWPMHNPKIISSILVICSILFITAIHYTNPQNLSDEVKSLPISAKHRLFIWDFAVDKSLEKPIAGYGFNSSRNIKTKDNDFVEYNNLKLNPLPIHPHNNLVQILLETGIVGFLLYLAVIAKHLNNWNLYFKNSNTMNIVNIRSAGYACFSTFFIISMISFNMWQSWWLYCYLWIASLFCFLTEPSSQDE